MADNSAGINSLTSHLSYLEPHAKNNSFYDSTIRRADSALFSFTNKANQACEKVTNPVREFIRPYNQSGLVYRAYGVADATNLSISLCGLFYTLKHAYEQSSHFFNLEEFQLSSKELHAAEGTPEGLTWVVLFSVFLVGFSTLGSFYDEHKDKPWVKHLMFLWPYARDASKQLKWWTKGWWALSGLLIQYSVVQQNSLIQFFFPLAMIGGIVSASNRIWLRWMRDNRKDMVKNNLDLIEGIKTSLHYLEKKPKSFIGYERSIIFLNDSTQKEARSLIYVDALGEAVPITMNEGEWESFCLQIAELQTKNIHIRMKQYLHYLRRANLSPTDLEIQEKAALLHFIAEKNDLGDITQSDEGMLFISADKYFESYIYFSDAEDREDTQRLYYVTKTGQLIAHEKNSQLFHAKYQETQQDKNIYNLSDVQLKSVLQSKIQTENAAIGHTYKQFIELRQKILNNDDPAHPVIQNQHPWIELFSPLSAGLSGIGDGLYFYLFVARVTVATLSPHLALFMLGTSVALFVICIITRIAQEFDFKRRLQVTILRPEIELSKKDCKYLHEQLEQLLDKLEKNKNKKKDEDKNEDLTDLITTLEKSRDLRRKQLIRYEDEDKDKDDVQTTQQDLSETLKQSDKAIILLWNELHDELKLGRILQNKLRANLDRSLWSAVFEGLQNGLAIQGAIASFSFMVSSLCYVSAAACPPAFLLTCLALGVAAIIVSCLQGIISYRKYRQKIEETRLQLSSEFYAEELGKMVDESDIAKKVGKFADLKQAVDNLNNQPLEPSVDFVVIEWSEIFRLFFKGAVKGRNAVLEILGRLLENTDNKWMLPILIGAGIASFASALGMRATAKGFAVGRPDSVNVTMSGFEKRSTHGFFDKLEKGVLARDVSMYLQHNQDPEDFDDNSIIDGEDLRGTPILI